MSAPSSRKPTFLRHWRKFRKLNQEQAAERLGVSQATLSKIERGELPYNQDFLETATIAYGAHEAADLLKIDPLHVDSLDLFFSQLRGAPLDIQRQARAIVEALIKVS